MIDFCGERKKYFVGNVDLIKLIFLKLRQLDVCSDKPFAAFFCPANAFFAQGDIVDFGESSPVFSAVRNIAPGLCAAAPSIFCAGLE